MALTTADAFNSFYERIKPDSLQKTVASRAESVTSVLQRAFPATSNLSFRSATLIGSLGRRTASKPVADIDLFVHLHVNGDLWRSSYSGDSTKFLYRVRDALNATSTVQKIGARGQAVRLFYADGLAVDVAAVEKYTDGSYAIPDGSGRWLKTNPIRHAQYLEERAAAVTGDLRRFVQIVKQWNRAHSARLTSFHLEMLAARTFATLNNDRRKALELFFGHNYDNLSVQDPAGHSGDLSGYLTTTQRQAVNVSLAAARDRASAANMAERAGNHREAIRLWRIVLGDGFPTYG